jgi:MFS family permease
MTSLQRLKNAVFISALGIGLTFSAFPLFYTQLNRPDGSGVVNSWLTMGQVLGAFVLTFFIDRIPRKSTAITGDVIRALLLGVLLLVPAPTIAILAIFALMSGIFEATTNNAIQAWLTEGQPSREDLVKLSSKIETASQVGLGLAPLIGTLILFVSDVKAVLALDLITYLIGIWLIAPLSNSLAKQKLNLRTMQSDFLVSFRWLYGAGPHRRWLGVSLLLGFVLAVFNTVYYPILMDRAKPTDQAMYLFQNSFFIGSTLGAFYMSRSKRSPKFHAVLGGCILVGVTLSEYFFHHYALLFLSAVGLSIGRISIFIPSRSMVVSYADPSRAGSTLAMRSMTLGLALFLMYQVVLLLLPVIGSEALLLFSTASALGAVVLAGTSRD